MSDPVKTLVEHDAVIAESGLEIWIGAEPTFTLRSSEQPQWLFQALGGDKQAYALRLVRELQCRHPGSAILRTVGRQYAGEEVPRWSFGLYQRRDDQPVWQGPPDPVLCDRPVDESSRLQGFAEQLEQSLQDLGWNCRRFSTGSKASRILLLVRLDGTDLTALDISDTRFARASVHDQKTPSSGLSDVLAEEGYYLFSIDTSSPAEKQLVVSVELPLFDRVDVYLRCLDGLSQAANAAGLCYLLLAGFPPPVDYSVAWTTVTPDPAVIEINQAPQPDSLHFYQSNSELFEVADQLGLSPYRLHYNGRLSDSGGGGQFTLGGREPGSSPFFVAPRLLPRLVRYVNAHPSLSYLFATEYVGEASQSPRCDEGSRDRFLELSIALDQIEKQANISSEFLYLSLAPFLADASGNTHRSELNIEKLWNTSLPQRGCLGLLEFRAFRMPATPQRSIAIAMLLRSITAMLIKTDPAPRLLDWQDELHDRFALPFFLRRDLRQVLEDIAQAGFALSADFQAELLSESDRARWSCEFPAGELSIEQAIEYWPLVGDVATQESVGSRLVDSSTLRLQIALQAEGDKGDQLCEWQLQAGGYLLPLFVFFGCCL